MASLLNKIADHVDELSALLSVEQGGSLAQARWEIDLLTKAFTTRTFLRQRVIRREGPLMFCKRDRLYQETLLTKNTKPIDAA
jgi:hypothetical protein